jgi:hypothetical protein
VATGPASIGAGPDFDQTFESSRGKGRKRDTLESADEQGAP